MNLRARHRPGLARLGDDIAAFHRVAAAHEEILVVRIGGDPAILVAQEDQVAIALQLVAGIGDHAAFGSAYARTLGNGDVDALIAGAVGLLAIGGDDLAADRPAEAGGGRRLGLGLRLLLGRRRVVGRGLIVAARVGGGGFGGSGSIVRGLGN